MHNDVLALSVDLAPECLAWGISEVTCVPFLNHGYNTWVVSFQKGGVAACLHNLVKLNATKAKSFKVGRKDLKRIEKAMLSCQISFCLGTLAETTEWVHNLLEAFEHFTSQVGCSGESKEGDVVAFLLRRCACYFYHRLFEFLTVTGGIAEQSCFNKISSNIWQVCLLSLLLRFPDDPFDDVGLQGRGLKI